ncbi:MAG: peptidase C39 family protein [Nitrospinota bacterium]
MAKGPSVRRAGLKDLDALARLEEAGFREEDAFGRTQLRRLLGPANAAAFIAEAGKRAVGSAIVLWRRGASVASLYTITTDPASRGKGVGSLLLAACERAAEERGCVQMRLEVRGSNRRALAFYERRGYRAIETLPAYYPGGESGRRLAKELGIPDSGALRLDVPYYAQTLGFTCGPACLMMAMKHFGPKLRLDRTLELVLWKEATTIFMTAGLGGCEPFGLAVAAERRGYRAEVIMRNRGVPFLGSVRTKQKKEVVRLLHQQMKAEAESLGAAVRYRNFTYADILQALREGAVPIVLVSTYRLHGFKAKAPHWVVVTGYDGRNVYLHDPYEGHYRHAPRLARHLRVPVQEFRRMKRWGKESLKSAVFIRQEKKGRAAG